MSNPRRRRFKLLGLGLLVVPFVALVATTGCSVVGIRTEEEPAHTVVEVDEEASVQVRRYEPMVVAATRVETQELDAGGNAAFRRLAGYIFGDNADERSLAMTAPVTRTPEAESRSLPMTAPVTRTPTEGGAEWTFFMPSDETLESLPTPLDPRVELREVPGRLVAALRFSGSFSDEHFDRQETRLRDWIAANGYRAVSPARSAGYDPPWTIPWFKRNEVLIDVEPLE